MKLLALVSMLLALVTHTAGANPLYQWIEKDGTPTFSPDPPPKGVDYTIVGPDLEPLTGQPVPSINLSSMPTTPTLSGSVHRLLQAALQHLHR